MSSSKSPSLILATIALCGVVICIVMASVALWLGSSANALARQQIVPTPNNSSNTPANSPDGISVPIGIYTKLTVPGNNQAYDAGVAFTFSSGSKFQVTVAGTYMFLLHFTVQNWNGVQSFSIVLNGTPSTGPTIGQLYAFNTNGLISFERTLVAQLVVGDTFRMYSDTTGAFNGIGSMNTLEIVKIQ